MKIKYFGILILSFCFSGKSLFAQERPIPIYQLQEIVVVGEKPLDPPYNHVEISKNEIERRGISNLAEALNLVAGIDVRTNSKGEVNLDLRGFGQRNTVIMIDGRPIYEPYFGTMDLSLIPVTNVEKITISRGVSTALYGPNAMGGVINIITKTAYKPGASVNYGSGNHRKAAVQMGKKAGAFAMSMIAGYDQADGFPVSRAFARVRDGAEKLRPNSDWRSSSLDGRISYQAKNLHTLSFSLGMIDAAKGVAPQVDAFRPRYWRFPEWKKKYADFSASFTLPAEMKLRTKFYLDRYENRLVNYKSGLYQTPTWESSYRNFVLGGYTYLDKHFSQKHFLTTGFLLKEDYAKIQPDVQKTWENYQAKTYSLVFQDKFSLHAKSSVTLGSSYDILSLPDGGKEVSFNPQGGLVYKPSQKISVYIMLGKKTRFPTLKENHQATLDNIHLKPEKAISYDFGIRRSSGNIFFSGTFFYSRAEDLINRKNRYSPFENIDLARMLGFESDLNFRVNSSHFARLQYVYLDAKDLKKNRTLDYRAKHKIIFSDHIKVKNFFDLTFSADYLSKRSFNDRGKTKSLPGYFILDLRMAKQIAGNTTISLTVQNLTDKLYEDEAGFPGQGRTIQFGFRLGDI